MLKIFKWAEKDFDKWVILIFTAFLFLVWFFAVTSAHYDIVCHRDIDKDAHQGRITRLENHLLILKRENTKLKHQQEILETMLVAVPELIGKGKR